jgi:hypothetical protein
MSSICLEVEESWLDTVLLPRLMVEGDLSSICCLVVDELHLLGDQSRGYLLELLLTKVYCSAVLGNHPYGLGFLDPDPGPLVRCTDLDPALDPSIIKQK